MPGKPQVSPTRLAMMLEVLSKNPSFKGRVKLHPDGGVEIELYSDLTSDKLDNRQPCPDLTDQELEAFKSSA